MPTACEGGSGMHAGSCLGQVLGGRLVASGELTSRSLTELLVAAPYDEFVSQDILRDELGI